MTLGEKLALLRRRRNVKQRTLAHACQTSQRVVSFWETDVIRIPAEVLPAIQACLGLASIEELYADVQAPCAGE